MAKQPVVSASKTALAAAMAIFGALASATPGKAEIFAGIYALEGRVCDVFSDSGETMTLRPDSVSFYECGCSFDNLSSVAGLDGILFDCNNFCEGEPMGFSRKLILATNPAQNGMPRVIVYQTDGGVQASHGVYTYCGPLP